MSFNDLALRRYSCRSYRDEPVEREKIDNCVQAARLSPSACNSQPWSFIVIDDPQQARRLPPALQQKGMPMNGFTRNCNAYIVIVEERANISARFGGLLKNQHYSQMDIGIAAEHIALCAADQGLGSCIIGWFDNSALRKILGFPRGKKVRLIVALGYPQKEETRPKVRKALEDIVHYNGWKRG